MRKIIVISLLAILSYSPAFACLGPQFEDHHYPSCTIPLPESYERVTVIYGDGPAELSDHHLGEADRKTRLVTVHIEDNNAQNYLVLSAREQTIWRIIGDVESITRIVALGASQIGPNGAGIIGVPADRIHFTSPDLAALDGVTRTSCSRLAPACIPSQWFGTDLDARISFHPKPVQPRQHVDEIVRWQSGWQGRSAGVISIGRPSRAGALVAISPELVVSQKPAQAYEMLPGSLGLKALIESGALIPASARQSEHIIQHYAETFSARYTSRFDPTFRMIPTIDYIVTRAITLPPELPPTALLVVSGVPAPEMNGNQGYSVCLYFEDQASQPVAGRITGNLCRLNGVSRAVPDDEQDILRAAARYDQLELGAQDCQMMSYGEGTHVAAIALSEGHFRRYRDDPIRQIDVEITREGPTVLFLSMEGGRVLWNISGPQVVEVYSGDAPNSGLTKVILNGHPYDYSRLRSLERACPQFAPLFPNRLGPSIAHLDEMFVRLTGQRIDQLVTFTDTGRAWRDPNWPIPVYVIE